jgi:GntR family transcriptional regulator, galactonate operon transcriptional repressor
LNLPHKRLYPSRALHARLAHEVGRRIISSDYPEGSNLPRESVLAEEFGVSRQAVREALKVLGAKGLVASRRRTGTSVLPRASWNLLDPDVIAWHSPGSIRREFLDDLVELRGVIEPAAAALAARRVDAERLARIKVALDGMRDNLDDLSKFLEADVEFHTALLTASGNSLFERLSTIIGPVLRVSFMLQARETWRYKIAVEQHAAVYEAIARGDPETAHDTMSEIVTTAQATVARITRDRSPPHDL